MYVISLSQAHQIGQGGDVQGLAGLNVTLMSESDRFGLLKFIGASHNLSEVRRLTQKQRALRAKKNLYKLIKLTNGLPMNREVRGDLAGG